MNAWTYRKEAATYGLQQRDNEACFVFDPGSDSVYSSAGLSVLARVLELAVGKPYAELLSEHVLLPAGMTDTSDAGTLAILEHRASSYVFDTDGLLNKAPADVPTISWRSSSVSRVHPRPS